MADLLYLSRSDVERLLSVDPLLTALERAFVELSAGRASVPPRIAALAPAGLLATMPGYLPGIGLAVKLVSVFPGNDRLGLSTHQGLIALFDASSGAPCALMDAEHITATRTAAASALATRLLARPDARILTVLGAGVQAQAHLDLMLRVREFAEVRVASRNPAHALELARRSPLGLVATSFEEAVRGADVICCCTLSEAPVIDRSWLAPGAHVCSVGSGVEVDAATVRAARVFVEWRGAVTSPPPAGAEELQGMDPAGVTEIGEVLSGAPGRGSEEDLTLYKSTGHAAEDVAAAALVYDRAQAEGIGTPLTI